MSAHLCIPVHSPVRIGNDNRTPEAIYSGRHLDATVLRFESLRALLAAESASRSVSSVQAASTSVSPACAPRGAPVMVASSTMAPPAAAVGAISFADVEGLSTEELRAEVERLKRLVLEETANLSKKKSSVVIQSLDDIDEAYPSRSATPSSEGFGCVCGEKGCNPPPCSES